MSQRPEPNPQRAATPESLFTVEGSWLLQDAGRNPVIFGVQAFNAAVESRVVRPGQAGPKPLVWRLKFWRFALCSPAAFSGLALIVFRTGSCARG